MRKIEFESLKIHRARDIIEERISGMIISGKIKPNEKIPTEKELSSQFNVSIVTVREALRGLEITGLIRKKQGKNGGIFVADIDNNSIMKTLHTHLKRQNISSDHLAEVRLMIEPIIIKNLIPKITSNELASLESNVTYCIRKLESSSEKFQLKEYRIIGGKNVEFHKILARATNNPVLALTMDYILEFISYFKKSMYNPNIDFCIKGVHDHYDILDALKKKDSVKAENIMRSHLLFIKEHQIEEY